VAVDVLRPTHLREYTSSSAPLVDNRKSAHPGCRGTKEGDGRCYLGLAWWGGSSEQHGEAGCCLRALEGARHGVGWGVTSEQHGEGGDEGSGGEQRGELAARRVGARADNVRGPGANWERPNGLREEGQPRPPLAEVLHYACGAPRAEAEGASG